MSSEVLVQPQLIHDLQQENQRLRQRATELEGENIHLRSRDAAVEYRGHHHRAIIESAVDIAIIATDRDGRITEWSKGAERILGWSAQEMQDGPVDRFFTPEDQLDNCVRNEMSRALELGRADDERWHLRKDGSHFWASIETVPLQGEDDVHLGFLKILRDRSGQKLMEVELRARQAHFRAALSIAKLGTFEWNVLNGVLRLDDRSRAIFGFSPTEGSRGQEILDRIEPMDSERVLAEIQLSLQTMSSLETEYRINVPTHTVQTIVSLGNVVLGAGGKVERMIGVFSDITERKRTEAALQGLNQALEQRIETRTHELEASDDQLRQLQKMEAVGQLTGGLAHDFNNLLSVISGSLELVQIHLTAGQTFDLGHYITAAQNASNRAAALTQRLLAFSRQQALSPKPTNVHRLVCSMEDLIRRTIGPRVVVEVTAGDGLWIVSADQNQLENALLNLCINAGHAMSNSGRLTISAVNTELDGQTARECDLPPGEYMSLCVTDTGTGMTPDVIKRAFDPFFTTKAIGLGSGLGLSMVYGFCRQSGGHVRITSELGLGTSICIYLPRHLGELEPEETQQDEPVAKTRASHGETVLVVEDEPTLRELVAEVLEQLGYITIEAMDAAAGLKVLRSDAHIDLLVSDIGLPGGTDGLEMADVGRSIRPGLKVLLITGYAENVTVREDCSRPRMNVLLKPFTMTALASQIREMIAD